MGVIQANLLNVLCTKYALDLNQYMLVGSTKRFWPNILHNLLKLVKGIEILTITKEDHNKYELIVVLCFESTQVVCY
jgi:hypothetical protein